MKGAPALLLVLLLGVVEGRNIAHNVLERSIEHSRPPLERQNAFHENSALPPRKALDEHHPQHELGLGEHKRMVPQPLRKDSGAIHAPRLPPQHLNHQSPEHLPSTERPHPAVSHPIENAEESSSRQHDQGKGLLEIVAEIIKPQAIKPSPAQHRKLKEGLVPPKVMTPHGMMIPRGLSHAVGQDFHHDDGHRAPPSHAMMGAHHPEYEHQNGHDDKQDKGHDDKDHHNGHDDKDHEGHDDKKDKGHDDKDHQGHDDKEDTGSQTDFPSMVEEVQGMIADVKSKLESSDLKTKIQSLKDELIAAVEAYKEAHGEDEEDVTTDAEGNTILIIVRAPDMAQVADAAFAGTGSGPDGEFTQGDWESALHNTQDMCADDFESLCGDNVDARAQSGTSDSSDSSDSKDHHQHWFRFLTEAPPPPPPPRGSSPPPGESGPLGFGSRENDMCLKTQRTSTSPACRLAMAQTEAIFRDLAARGMAPRPPFHMHAHGSIFGIIILLACCCCCMKCRRCRHAQKLKMKRTLAALSSGNQEVKLALEDAAGVTLPSPEWKSKVALAVDANPELKAAVAQLEQTYVPAEEEILQRPQRISNPFTGMSHGHHTGGRCRRACKVVLLVFAGLMFLSMLGHGHAPEDQPEEEPQDGAQDGSKDGEEANTSAFGFFFTLAMFCFCMSFVCFVFQYLRKKFFGQTPAVAVNVEDEPNFVPSTVANGTVTSYTTKYVELEKGTSKI